MNMLNIIRAGLAIIIISGLLVYLVHRESSAKAPYKRIFVPMPSME